MSSDAQETKRDRVRRLLIHPLQEAGMRAPHRSDRDKHQAFLDRLCDNLSYLSDEHLRAIWRWAQANGQGSAKCFWPERVAFITLAHLLSPRRAEDVPEIASWFRSRAGVEALQDPVRAVTLFRFIQKHLRPPIKESERSRVDEYAAGMGADVERARRDRGKNQPYNAEMLDAFETDLARVQRLVQSGVEHRATQSADAA